jgi:CheY-like chemotaxis protein
MQTAEISYPLSGTRVLIVEDETLVAMLLEDMIGELGGDVVASAGRVARALAILDEQPIDLAVLDVNLGSEDAFPIAEALVKRGIPFVFSTGYGSTGLPPDWRKYPTLQKPFTEIQVASVLGGAIANAPAA